MNPIEAVKEVASGNNLKLGVIIMIMIALIASSLIYRIVSLMEFSSFSSFGNNIWAVLQSITRPLFLVIVPAVIIFVFNMGKSNKKSLLVILSTMVVTMVPTIFIKVLYLIDTLISQLSIFTTPRNAFFASTIVLALLSVGMHYQTEVIVSFMFLNTVVMTAMSNLKFSKRSDLLIIAFKITITGILLVGGIYLLERFMMDIDNFKFIIFYFKFF